MRLFNLTELDDKSLERVLYVAAKKTSMGVRTSNVVVKVSKGKSRHGRVRPSRQFNYCVGWLKGKPRSKWTPSDGKLLFSDGGTMLLWLWFPTSEWLKERADTLAIAEDIFRLAAHEWKHVSDMQNKRHFGQYKRNWKNRPHERRAVYAEKRAMRMKDKKTEIQDAILNLAINIQGLMEKK